LQKVGGELAAGISRIVAVEPDVAGISKEGEVDELIQVLAQLGI